jgi:hypothetical protein
MISPNLAILAAVSLVQVGEALLVGEDVGSQAGVVAVADEETQAGVLSFDLVSMSTISTRANRSESALELPWASCCLRTHT